MKSPIDLEVALARRDIRFSRPVVVSIPATTKRLGFFQTGTVSLLLSDSASAAWAELQRLAQQQSALELDRLALGVMRQYGKMSRTRLRIFASLEEVPVLGEMRYGRKSLRAGMFVGGPIQVAVARVLYNGGEIDTNHFELVEYVRPASQRRLSAVIVVRPPRLSKIERQILKRVPATQSEVHLGDAAGLWMGGMDEVADFVNQAYDLQAADRAATINTPDIIDQIYKDVWKALDESKDLTKDFWDQAKAQDQAQQAQQDQPQVEQEQPLMMDLPQQQWQLEQIDQAQAEQDQAQQDQEAQQEVDNAEGGRFAKLIDELAVSGLSPTASARTLLALRAQLLISGEFAKYSKRLASAASQALGGGTVSVGSVKEAGSRKGRR